MLAQPLPWTRVWGFLATASIIGFVSDWNTWTYSLGFTHFLAAFAYAGRPLRSLALEGRSLWVLPALVAVPFLLYAWSPSLLIYFGLHHALNEAYAKRHGVVEDLPFGPLRAVAAFWHGCVYAFLLRHHAELFWIGPEILAAAVLLAGVALVSSLASMKDHVRTRELFYWAAPELVAGCAVVLSLVLEIRLLHIILYHFMVWLLLPLPRLWERGRHSPGVYAAFVTVSTLSFFTLSPAGALGAPEHAAVFLSQFIFWSYAHITASFAISDAHPDWIVRLFRPAAAV